MGNDREEKIDQWIFQDGVKKDRRKKIIPSSTDSIMQTPVGTALDAMEKVAFYFGDRPDLPIVELGLIKENEISLTFGVDVELEAPFWPVYDDHKDHWGITHQGALALSTGHVYGQQTAALTAVGNSMDGDKVLLNTNRWHVLGSVGLAQFSTAIMVGQVMEQATEPWAKEHHIWLVGYHELGPKLINFLTHYHDEFYFHLAETVEQITVKDLAGTSATLYVMGSSDASLKAYDRLRSQNVGMLTDTVVTELAMFISEDDDGGATILNATPQGLKIWPNLVGEGDPLYEAMEITWQKHLEEAQEAQAAVETLTIADFLPEAPVPPTAPTEIVTSSSNISAEELEALMNFESVIPDHERTAPAVAPVSLSILGEPQLCDADGATVEGKPAEAVAYLHFHGLSSDSVELSQALWPAAENEGNTARTRRARTAKKIKETLPDSFRNDTQWGIDPLPTDLDQIITVLNGDGDPQEAVRACQAIELPLQSCAEWADEHRSRIVKQLRQVLEDTTDRALENDQFEIAKAARQAAKKL